MPSTCQADSRLPRGGPLRAVGWSADVEALAATLHLPPGWTLLAATGVDQAPGAWTGRWTLLGFFFVLVVALATGRLFGRAWGVIALLAVVFLYDEPGAPFLVWLSLLGATALSAVAPEGWLRRLARIWRGASLLALLVILVPFVRDQVLGALYPQIRAAGLGDLLTSTPRGRWRTPCRRPRLPLRPRQRCRNSRRRRRTESRAASSADSSAACRRASRRKTKSSDRNRLALGAARTIRCPR